MITYESMRKELHRYHSHEVMRDGMFLPVAIVPHHFFMTLMFNKQWDVNHSKEYGTYLTAHTPKIAKKTENYIIYGEKLE